MPITGHKVSNDVSKEALFLFGYTLLAHLVPDNGAKMELTWTILELCMNRI